MRVRSTQALDEVVRGDEAVVLINGQILRVSALAQSLRGLATDWIELPALAQALAEVHGEPDGDPFELLTSIVADLVIAGLLETSD